MLQHGLDSKELLYCQLPLISSKPTRLLNEVTSLKLAPWRTTWSKSSVCGQVLDNTG